MGLTFINIHGDAVSVASVKTVRPKALSPDSFHKGWHVVGFSPEQLAEARRRHEAEPHRPRGSTPDAAALAKPFDEAAYMRTNKPRRVRSKPYEVYEAALECADLARRAGWLLMQAVPRAKGAR